MTFEPERIFKGPGFAETLYLGVCDGERVIRKMSKPGAFAFSRIALAREIRLLETLPSSIAPFFIRPLRSNLEGRDPDGGNLPDPLYYDMPYYAPEDGWRSLSSCLMEGTLAKEESCRVVDRIADAVFVYLAADIRPPVPDYADVTMLRAIRESIAWAANKPGFRDIFAMPTVRLNGRSVHNIPLLVQWFEDTERVRPLVTPRYDRFLHGDFFPENILYNMKNGQWLLLDPVSVRGIHRGDFILDLDKMQKWLTGELPALRSGQFSISIDGGGIEYELFTGCGKLKTLARLGVADRYRERLGNTDYAALFREEPGWEIRRHFIRAFYAFCMLPLADERQSLVRYAVALDAMDAFKKAAGL